MLPWDAPTPTSSSVKGQWVCVQSGEIIDGTDVAVVDGRVAFVGADASHTVGKDTVVIDAHGKYLVPGLLDGHMHVELGMVTVTEFVRAVAPRGTTGMFIDPHEIANVFGLKGVKLMVDEAAKQPIHVWVQVPSCVPSAPGFETPGASISPEDVAEALTWPGVIGLGEMMNFPGVAKATRKCWPKWPPRTPQTRRLAVTTLRRTWVCPSTDMWRVARKMTTRARASKMPLPASARV